MIESISLIPILNQNALLSYVEEAFANGSVFVTDKLELDVLLKLGELTILLLLTYESLVDTVLISFQDSQVQEFKQLKSFVPTLISNLQAIKIEIQKRSISSKSVEVLNFYALAKFYQSVTSYDLANINNMVDFDEDVHLAFQLSLNHENKDEHSIMIWNFIYKAYCWRHLFKGEVPFLTQGRKLNSAPIIDPLLTIDFPFLNLDSDLVRYLQTKDRLISLQKVVDFNELYKVKYTELQRKATSLPSMIDNTVNCLIYRNTTVFLMYYLLLQYEKLNQDEKFIEIYKEFLQLIQETLFYIFSNLANLRFAGHEFMLSLIHI